MFLPVLFLRDYGTWGWVLFAVPNVIGAAAMGWTLRDPEASRAIQQQHFGACRAFSLVTLAFHAWFVFALLPRLMGDESIWLTAALLAPLLLLLPGRGRTGRRATISSAVVLAISVVAMLTFIALRGFPVLSPPAHDRVDLFWLAPVVVFGFLLDPYLDLTFHRARQSTSRAGGRTAFGVGFGLFFLTMIVFTALYAPALLEALSTGHRLAPRVDLFAGVLLVHICVQTAFTLAAHLVALRETLRVGASTVARFSWVLGFATAILVAMPLRWLQQRFPAYHGLATAEMIYRLFLAFYGLVFPAYVWLFVVPRRSRGIPPAGAVAPSRGQVLFFAAVVVLAAPLYWMSFIEGRMRWAVPGLLLVLFARFLLPRPAPSAPPAPSPVQ
jgi:hypothetical protein